MYTPMTPRRGFGSPIARKNHHRNRPTNRNRGERQFAGVGILFEEGPSNAAEGSENLAAGHVGEGQWVPGYGGEPVDRLRANDPDTLTLLGLRYITTYDRRQR